MTPGIWTAWIAIVVGLCAVGLAHSKDLTIETIHSFKPIDSHQLSKQELFALLDSRDPLLLLNPFEREVNADAWIKSFRERFADNEVVYDRILPAPNYTVEYDLSKLSDFMNKYDVDREDGSKAMLQEETLLHGPSDLRDVFTLNISLSERDLFLTFPDQYQSSMAIFIGGRGSRSDLHVDPKAWTGWNYLLKGSIPRCFSFVSIYCLILCRDEALGICEVF